MGWLINRGVWTYPFNKKGQLDGRCLQQIHLKRGRGEVTEGALEWRGVSCPCWWWWWWWWWCWSNVDDNNVNDDYINNSNNGDDDDYYHCYSCYYVCIYIYIYTCTHIWTTYDLYMYTLFTLYHILNRSFMGFYVESEATLPFYWFSSSPGAVNVPAAVHLGMVLRWRVRHVEIIPNIRIQSYALHATRWCPIVS